MSTTNNKALAVRANIASAQDTFVRANTTASTSISSGWGTASDGESYSRIGNASVTWQISSNRGAATASTGVAYGQLGTNSFDNCEVKVRCSTTGNAATVGLGLRFTDASNHYRIRLTANTLAIISRVSGTVTTLASASFTFSNTTSYWIKARCVGNVIYAKAWADGSAEPANFTIQATDTNFTTGKVVLLVSLNLSTDFVYYDSLVVTSFSTQSIKTLQVRFNQSVTNSKTLLSRFRLQATNNRAFVSRFLLQATAKRTLAVRFNQGITNSRAFLSRFRLQATRNRAFVSRFLLQATSRRVFLSRFRQQVTNSRAFVSRFVQQATNKRAFVSRFRLQSTNSRAFLSRFRQKATTNQTVLARFLLQATTNRAFTSRFRQQATSSRAFAVRFILSFSGKKFVTRFRLTAVHTINLLARFRIASIQDTFVRANTSASTSISAGWGTATDGETWYSFGSTPNWQIQSNRGTVTNNSSQNYAILGTQSFGNCEITVRLSISNNSGGVGILARYFSANNHYHITIVNNVLNIVAKTGSNTVIASTAYTMTGGTNHWLKVRLEDDMIYAKAWADGATEPNTFLIGAPDSSFGSGWSGLYINLANASHTASFDSFSLVDRTGGYRFVPTRFRLGSVQKHWYLTRFIHASVKNSAIATRFRLQATRWRTFQARFPLAATKSKILAARFRQNPSYIKTMWFHIRAIIANTTTPYWPVRFNLGTPHTYTLATRFRQGFVRQLLLAIRYRQSALRQPFFAVRSNIGVRPIRAFLVRFILNAIVPSHHRHQFAVRFVLAAGTGARTCQVRFNQVNTTALAAGGNVPGPFYFQPSGNSTVSELAPPATLYLVNGTTLPTQPAITTSPEIRGQLLNAGETFLLIFNNPDSTTQSMLATGQTVSMQFALYNGAPFTCAVSLVSSMVGGTSFQVYCTIASTVYAYTPAIVTQFA